MQEIRREGSGGTRRRISSNLLCSAAQDPYGRSVYDLHYLSTLVIRGHEFIYDVLTPPA